VNQFAASSIGSMGRSMKHVCSDLSMGGYLPPMKCLGYPEPRSSGMRGLSQVVSRERLAAACRIWHSCVCAAGRLCTPYAICGRSGAKAPVDASTMTRHAQGASAQACLLSGRLRAVPSAMSSVWVAANQMVELSEQSGIEDYHGQMQANAPLLQC